MRRKPLRHSNLIPGREAARRLQVDEKTIRRWIREGKLARDRHYLQTLEGRRIFVWPALAADFLHTGKEIEP